MFLPKKRQSTEQAPSEDVEILKEQISKLEKERDILTEALDKAEQKLYINEQEIKEINDAKLDWKTRYDVLNNTLDDTLSHVKKESDSVINFPIRDTVCIYNEFFSVVCNQIYDCQNIDELRSWAEQWIKYTLNKLGKFGYRFSNHPRNVGLISDYKCDSPSIKKTGIKEYDGKVFCCDIIGVDFPDSFKAPILSQITVYEYDISKDDNECSFSLLEGLDSSEVAWIMDILYRSVDSICIDPYSAEDIDNSVGSISDFRDNNIYFDEDYEYLLEMNVHGEEYASDREIMNHLLEGTIDSDCIIDANNNARIDIYVRISLSIGIVGCSFSVDD